MLFKVVGVSITAAFAYMLQGVEGDQALILLSLPLAAAVTFILLG
ncbi:MAG: hypothetical protein ABL893_08035 [Hyphomicrobium sp.]